MPEWLEKLLGTLYVHLPAGMRPFLKKAFLWVEIRISGYLSGRLVRNGWRVAFLNFEIAHLERYEYLQPGRGEVELVSHYSTVSPGTERAVLCGLPGARRSFPYFPGYSCSGIVSRVGRGVTGFRRGDCVAGRMRHASAGSTFAEFLFRVPDGVELEAASFIELGIITLQGVRKARISPGERVAVLGQGLIGQLANRVIRATGAGEVIAIAPSGARAQAAIQAGGADRFLEIRQKGFQAEEVLADVVIEAVGTPDAILLAAQCARPGGRVILLGSSRGLSRDVDIGSLVQHRGIELIGAHISNMPAHDNSPYRYPYRREGELFLELLRSGRLSVQQLVTWRPTPEECNAVYEAVAQGGGKHVAVVFDWRLTNAARLGH